MILGAMLVEACEVDTHTKSCRIFRWHHDWVSYPLDFLEVPNESCFAESINFFTNSFSFWF